MIKSDEEILRAEYKNIIIRRNGDEIVLIKLRNQHKTI